MVAPLAKPTFFDKMTVKMAMSSNLFKSAITTL